ncbi:hypothetical protein D3C76_1768170 [compost metagenome]
MLGEEFVYKNPYMNVRLNDDEIAVATCMDRMGEYLATGAEFYSLKEALQDTYIALMMDSALKHPNLEVRTSTRVWTQ